MHTPFKANETGALRGDALELLQSLPEACAAVAFFDPQHRSVLDKLKYGDIGYLTNGVPIAAALAEGFAVKRIPGTPNAWLNITSKAWVRKH